MTNQKKEVAIFETPELKCISKSKADQIKNTFEPMATMLKKFEKVYDEIITESKKEITIETTNKARNLRLDISKIRIQAEKVRKEEKAEYLRAGKAIDGVSNILKWAIVDKEEKLHNIEKHFELIEIERLENLQKERVEKIRKFIDEEAEMKDFSTMDEDVWAAYFFTKKTQYNNMIAAEKKAEAERIKEEQRVKAEQEKIRKENILLKEIAKQKEEKLQIETERLRKIEAGKEAKRQKERKKIEAERQAERKKFEIRLEEQRQIQRRKADEAKKEAERQAKEKAKIEADKQKKAIAEMEAKQKKDHQNYKIKFDDKDAIIRFLIKVIEAKNEFIRCYKLGTDHLSEIPSWAYDYCNKYDKYKEG